MPPTEDLNAQIETICASNEFINAPQSSRLLRFLIQKILGGKADDLTQDGIAFDFFLKKPEAWDPKAGKGDSIVRRAMGNLRLRLKIYYERTGFNDPISIKITKGGYIPQIDTISPPPPTDDLDHETIRSIVKSKLAIDLRKYHSDQNAMDLLISPLELYPYHPRVLANAAFVRSACTTLAGHANHRFDFTEFLINRGDEKVKQFWECAFAEGCVQAAKYHNWQLAREHFARAVERSQLEAIFYWWPLALAAAFDDIDSSIFLLRRTLDGPSRTNVMLRADLCTLLIIKKEFALAQELLAETVEIAPHETIRLAGYYLLLYEAMDDAESAWQAIETFNQFPMQSRRAIGGWFQPAFTPLVLGRLIKDMPTTQRVHRYYAATKAGTGNAVDVTPAIVLAIAAIGLNLFDEAVDWMHYAAYVEHEPLTMWFHIFPPFRHLTKHAGYRRLLRKLKLPSPS